MRQIENKTDKERKSNRNKVILGIILVGLMVLSTAGYSLLSREKSEEEMQTGQVKYNNLIFTSQGDYWQTEISGYQFYFHYLPNETEDISLKRNINDYAGKPLYFVGEKIAQQEIAQNLNSFVQRVQQACLKDENCTGDWPVKTCADNVIIIQEKDNVSNIVEEENCTFIISNDTLRDADAFLFSILGVK